jgi:uncharacterized membrane protein HdeD (DUF308 family)
MSDKGTEREEEDRGSEPSVQRTEAMSESVVVVTTRDEPPNRSWGTLLALGIVALVFGIVVLANIWASVRLVAIFAGLFLLFAGVLQFVRAGGAQQRAGKIVAGIVAVVAGILLIAWPEASVKTVAVIVGVSFLIWGIVWAVAALVDRGEEGWGVAFGFGVLLAIIGVVVVAWPGPTIAVLMILVGLNAVLFGVASIAQAIAIRRT